MKLPKLTTDDIGAIIFFAVILPLVLSLVYAIFTGRVNTGYLN